MRMSAIFVFLLIIQGCFSVNSALCDSTTYRKNVEQKLDQLSTEKGYKMTKGRVHVAFNSTYTVSNPASAYGVYLFSDNGHLQAEWTMSSSDAIIFSGCTMPKGKYFSFQHYIHTRFINNNGMELFADLGAATNHLVINTTSSTSFDSLTTVILTGDQQTANDLKSVLDPSALNILSIPQQYVYFNPGSNDTVDTFEILYRMALWQNMTQFVEYVNSINNQVVWRLSLPDRSNNNVPRIPYKPYVRNDNCSYNEVDIYNATLNEYKSDLIKYIETTYSYKYVSTFPFIDCYAPPHYYGFDCITNNIDCLGDSRDATYWGIPNPMDMNSSEALPYNDQSFYLALGINHENTKQSVYIDITIYDYVQKEGQEVVGELTGAQLNKSALILPVNTDINKEYLSNMWIAQISRPANCIYNNRDQNTVLIPGFCYNETQFKETGFMLVTRNYLNPETKTHPNTNQIVGPILLYFST